MARAVEPAAAALLADLRSIRRPAPWLGQHTEETLRTLDYGEADIAALFAAGVLYDKYRGGQSA